MKIKSFVGLNNCGDSYNLAEDNLPNENDEVYFTLINQEYPYDEYYKGTYQENNFYSEGICYSVKEVESWCLANDPTAIQRLIFRFDLDFYFDLADWERWNKNGSIYDDYPNSPSAVGIEELGLSEQTETLLREYIEFAESHNSFNCADPIALHNIDQMGLFVYEELRQELTNKCYLIYCPISGDNENTNFPMLVDNNEGNFSWINPAVKLPVLGKEVYLQLDSFTGEFKKGWLEKCGDNYFIRYKGIDYLDINRICRWQYTDE